MKLKKLRKVVFFEGTHTYFCGDKTLIGVTTLMKKHGLSPDYSGISEEVLKKAAARGTAVHHLLEDYDNGKMVVETPELKAYKELGLKVFASEYLVSDKKLVASSIDKVLETDEENVVDLGDVKTTSTLHIKPLEWQLSIYAYLFEKQNKGIKVRNLYGIHVRDGKAKLRLINRIDDEVIAELLKCEEDGVMFIDPTEPEKVLSVLSDEDALMLAENEEKLAMLNESVKELEAIVKVMRDKVYTYMLDENLDEMECGGGIFKLKRPYTKEAIDTKALKASFPEIAEKFTKTSEVKGSVTFKTK